MFKTTIDIWSVQIETAQKRRSFVYRSFIQFIVYVLFALVQWLTILAISRSKELTQRHESTLVVIFFVSMLFFVVFAISDQLRLIKCMNWVITLVIVECLILAIGLLVVTTDYLRLVLGFLFVSIILLFAILLGFLMPYDLTKNIHILIALTFYLFVLSCYAIVLYEILKLTWPFLLYAPVILIMVLPVLVYHVQCILGNGHIRTSLDDDKLAALLLFHDFLALFMLTFYWQPTRGVKQ